MGVTAALIWRIGIEMDLREEERTKRPSPPIKENSSEISREDSIRQFKLISILPPDFVNQSQSLAFSVTRITHY
jgi:hypothetical protein